MLSKLKNTGLTFFVVFAILAIGLVPLVLTGWFLSGRSATELRAVEGRYQTQLVQDKARQIEMFGQRYGELVRNFADAFEIAGDAGMILSVRTEERISQILKENPTLTALYIKPAVGESLSVFRAEQISRAEVEKLSSQVSPNSGDKKLLYGKPQQIEANGEIVLPIASQIIVQGQSAATVTALVSMRELQTIMAESRPAGEAELWQSGLPIVFVVDDQGRAVFHPDKQIVAQRRNFSNLRIVQEWHATKDQIQSALMPFETEYAGETYKMLGSYSTADFGKQVKFGVIVMQNESKALASVGEMRFYTWLISLAFAVLAVIIGFLLARKLTNPLQNLVSAAQKIASGDLSTRIAPLQIREINTLGEAFNTMSGELEEHIANLARAAQENRELFVGTVKALAAAIDGKDRYTRGHSERVCRVSVAIGQRLGLDEEELETLRISALLHDVGKIGIDDSILKKPSALTEEEYEIMKTHPQQGYKIMKNIPAMKDFLPGMYMHHEMVNGQGYPQGLKGDEIPLQAKIVSVADTFDAMTIDRPYSKGMELQAALERIATFVGTRYDGKVVEALIEACNDGQIGIGTVKLRKSNEPNAQPSHLRSAA